MATFWRLLGFLRPYRGGVIASLDPRRRRDGRRRADPLPRRPAPSTRSATAARDLWPLGLAVAGAGVLRLVFSVARRLVAGQVSLGVEYDLRNRMYEHLHALELAFFDGQQTGQLMSRATVDLQSVRFFLGYGLIFIVQSALSIVIAAAVMLALNVELALVALAPTPFVVWVAYRYGRQNRPATQEVQQRIAELTADAEENIGGVRVVKGFAQEERQYERFERQRRARVRPVDGLDAPARVLQPVHRLPAAARPRRRAVRRRPPDDQRHDLGRRLRRLLRLRDDADLADAHARHGARHGPARGRLRHARVRAARPRAAADRRARRAAAAGGRRARRAARRALRLRRRRAGAATAST